MATLATPLAAQTVSTVRETEFRSRWVDQQVDRPQLEVGPQIPVRDPDADFGTSVAETMRTLFRTGPVVFRAGVTAGIEYTSSDGNVNFTSQPSNHSLFAAPVISAIYEREVGPWSVSARYSVGYVYYFNRDYIGAGGSFGTPDQTVTVVVEPEQTVQVRDPSRDTVEFVNGIRVVRPGFRTERIPEVTEEQTVPGQPARPPEDSLPSQTAGLDFKLTLSRLSVRSSGGASYGSGFDTNRGSNQERLTLTEALSADYQLTEYTRAGVLLSGSYERNSQYASDVEDVFTRLGASIFADYFITGKSRLRAEASTGSDTRSFGAGGEEERTYYQVQFRANYQPTAKILVEASTGLGMTETTGTETSSEHDGLRNIYSLSVNYAPTEKISARLYFGLEATATEPEFSLSLGWVPRDTMRFNLSAYQLSGATSLSFTQNRISRGFLVTGQQRLFQRGLLVLTGGWEEYEDIDTEGSSTELEPFSYFAAAFSWEFSRWMAIEAMYRSSSQSTSVAGNTGTREDRAALSLRLTF